MRISYWDNLAEIKCPAIWLTQNIEIKILQKKYKIIAKLVKLSTSYIMELLNNCLQQYRSDTFHWHLLKSLGYKIYQSTKTGYFYLYYFPIEHYVYDTRIF